MTTDQPFNWRACTKVHPAADMLPLSPPAEQKELGDNILANGLCQPILVDLDGALLDGRNRLDALALAGLLAVNVAGDLVTTKTWKNGNWHPACELIRREISLHNVDPYDLVLSLNAHRRHLTPADKDRVIDTILKGKPELSNRQVGKLAKADHHKVAGRRRKLEATGEASPVEKTVGADGKVRKSKPARKPNAAPVLDVPTATAASDESTAATATADTATSAPRTKPAVSAKDIALERFDAYVLELIRLTKGQRPQRFAKTAVAQPLLGDLAHFLRELVTVRKLAVADDPAVSAGAKASLASPLEAAS